MKAARCSSVSMVCGSWRFAEMEARRSLNLRYEKDFHSDYFWWPFWHCPGNTQCRIGETLEECKTRYGEPVEIKKDTALFIKNGMTVSAHFVDGKVDQITYYSIDPKDSKKTICPSNAEVDILLQASARGGSWKMELARRNHAIWWNKERGLSAARTPQELVISIHQPDTYKAYEERKAAIRKLEGF